MSVIPLLTVVLTAAFSSKAAIENNCAYLRKGYCDDVRKLLPTMDQELVDLLESAKASAKDPMISLDASHTIGFTS